MMSTCERLNGKKLAQQQHIIKSRQFQRLLFLVFPNHVTVIHIFIHHCACFFLSWILKTLKIKLKVFQVPGNILFFFFFKFLYVTLWPCLMGTWLWMRTVSGFVKGKWVVNSACEMGDLDELQMLSSFSCFDNKDEALVGACQLTCLCLSC